MPPDGQADGWIEILEKDLGGGKSEMQRQPGGNCSSRQPIVSTHRGLGANVFVEEL